MTENAHSPTDRPQPPAPWLQQPDATVPNWALGAPHSGPPQPPLPRASVDGARDARPARQFLQSSISSISSVATDRPEVVIGVAFAGGIVVALIINRLAR